MRTVFFLFLSFLFSLPVFSQSNWTKLQREEHRLDSLLQLVRTTKDDKILDEVNQNFKREFKKALQMKEAFSYPFSSFTTVGDIYSADSLVRIFSWNIQYINSLAYNYYCFILKKDKRRGEVTVTELKRGKQHLQQQKYEVVDAENWYGALYYDIIDVQRRSRTYYTLLGYDGNNQKTTIKFIDILYFTGSTPHLGKPYFETDKGRAMRLLFEYSDRAVMSMSYNKKRELIIMDHLSPETPAMKGFREFYVPDMSYDSYKWDGKQWILIPDIIATNAKKPEELTLKAYDPAADTVINVKVENKWINPNDPNAPIGNGRHVAITPEEAKAKRQANNEATKSNSATSDWSSEQSDKSFNGISYSHLGESKKERRKRLRQERKEERKEKKK